ncbi:MAG: hypothetical protein M3Y91_13290 [Actinomycetota bacterium]|nr:hypothetical protein [Actinomycetota bacterium]
MIGAHSGLPGPPLPPQTLAIQQAYTAHKTANAALVANDETGAPIVYYLQTEGIKADAQDIVTALVLIAAATVDAVARRGRTAA